MTTWAGWESQLADALNVQDTTEVGYLLRTWGSEEASTCANNPVAASRKASGSTNCKQLPNGLSAQNYTSRASGLAAAAAQLKSGNYPHLWAAIESGNPYNVVNTQQVADDLTKWGAQATSVAYLLEVSNGTFGSGVPLQAPPGIKAARLHRGYSDLQRSVNKHLPDALHSSRRSLNAGLRSLARARKVRL